jgi:hypothetical protein
MHRVSWARYGLGILTKNGKKNGNKNGTDTHTTHQGSRAKNPHLTAILLTPLLAYISKNVRQSSILGPPSAKRQGSFAMTLRFQNQLVSQIDCGIHRIHTPQNVRQSSILGPPSAKRQGSFAMTLRFQNPTLLLVSCLPISFYYVCLFLEYLIRNINNNSNSNRRG